MSKVNCRTGVVIFALFLAIFNTGCVKSSEKIADERAVIKAEWLKDTREVVERINDEQITEVFQFLEQNSILVVPIAQGVQYAEDGKDNWFAILPLLEKDKEVSDYWKGLFAVSSAANFLPPIRTMVLKSYIPYSSTGKALVFLHEGYHAYVFVHEPYEGQQAEQDYCYEEVQTHSFQNMAMSLLGGEKYQEVLDTEVARITVEAEKEGGEIGDTITARSKYDERLADVFGQPASQIEKDFIQTSVWIHATFVFLEKNFQGDVERQKALFLRTLYKDDGILK